MNTVLDTGRTIRRIALSANGRTLTATASEQEGVQVYSVGPSGLALAREIAGAGGTECLLHPTDGTFAILRPGEAIQVFEVATGRHVRSIGTAGTSKRGRTGYIGSALSPDGRFVDTHSIERARGERFEWASGGEVGTRWGEGGPLAWHPDGSLLAVCEVRSEGYSQVRFGEWQGARFRVFAPQLGSWSAVGGMAFGPDGQSFAMLGGVNRLQLQVHDVPTCGVRFVIEIDPMLPDELEWPDQLLDAIAFRTDGRTIFTPTPDGSVVERSIDNGAEVHRWSLHRSPVTSLALDPLRGLLYSSGLEGTLACTALEGWPAPIHGVRADAFRARFGDVADDADLSFEP